MAKATLIFDGYCNFCKRQADRLVKLSGNRVTLESFRDPGVLERHPGITSDECEQAMQLIQDDGRRSAGAQAAADMLRLNPWLAWAGWFYYLPGVGKVQDFVYRWVARNRFRFGGCSEGGSCQIHPPH